MSSDDRGQDRVRLAWAGLAGLHDLGPLEVVAQPRSALCPAGWVGVLRLDDTVTVAVPDPALVEQVRTVFGQLAALEATNPEILVKRLSGVSAVLGPATLYYAMDGIAVPSTGTVIASLDDVDELVGSVSAGDLEESGLRQVTSPLFVARDQRGIPVAACGYERWPEDLAHLCVLTNRRHRRRGLGRAVAVAAIAHAIDEGLLPQWRAHPEASKALARSLGLTERGEQLSLRLGES